MIVSNNPKSGLSLIWYTNTILIEHFQDYKAVCLEQQTYNYRTRNLKDACLLNV